MASLLLLRVLRLWRKQPLLSLLLLRQKSKRRLLSLLPGVKGSAQAAAVRWQQNNEGSS